MRGWLIFGSVLLLGCGSDGGALEPEPPAGPAGPGGSQPAPVTAQVSMQSGDDGYGDFTHGFSPRTVAVARGGRVTWTNQTGVVHNVTFGSAEGAPANIPAYDSGSHSRDFGTAGEFAYSCTLHAGMSGTINVVD